ncbi:hypothetical protein CRYUN_Cryun19dG0060900 [Craigia yunnanensis]
MQNRISTAVKDVQKQLDLIVNYDWDFDHYLEEDVPAAVDPAQVLNVPVIPIGALLAAAHPFATRPPYILSWQYSNSADDASAVVFMCAKSSLSGGWIRDRNGTFFHKDHLCKSNVSVLAIAGDQDLICPPEAYVMISNEQKQAIDLVYPNIIEFLNHHEAA